MKYEKTKQISMRHYPRLFLTDNDFMYHMFFVLGNGYRWHNGELVQLRRGDNDEFREVTEEELEQENIRHRENMKQQHEDQQRWYREHMPELYEGKPEVPDPDPYFESQDGEIEYRNTCIREFDDGSWFKVEGATDPKTFGISMYPQCKLSCIANIPDDIQPDWLDALEKAIEWAESPLCKLAETDKPFIAKAKRKIKKLRADRS